MEAYEIIWNLQVPSCPYLAGDSMYSPYISISVLYLFFFLSLITSSWFWSRRYGSIWNDMESCPYLADPRPMYSPHVSLPSSRLLCLPQYLSMWHICDYTMIYKYIYLLIVYTYECVHEPYAYIYKHIPISRIHPICCVSFCKTWNQCFFLCLIIEHFIFFSCIHIPWSLLWHYRCWLLTICGCHKCYLHNGPLTYKPTSHGNMWHLRI